MICVVYQEGSSMSCFHGYMVLLICHVLIYIYIFGVTVGNGVLHLLYESCMSHTDGE